jgi:hypothetical protein
MSAPAADFSHASTTWLSAMGLKESLGSKTPMTPETAHLPQTFLPLMAAMKMGRCQ